MIAIPTRFKEFGFSASRSALTCALLERENNAHFFHTLFVVVVFTRCLAGIFSYNFNPRIISMVMGT